ncbi:MAG: polysaccharide biosynthesis tyrosine autokinase [Phycisphaerales bacterium]|nr:polysaccharide biosynthesis tyrosine autokinase [Phycisphaerales bacterium]
MTTLPTTIQEQIPLPGPVVSHAPQAASKGLTPADILGMLRQRLVTIIILSILFSGMGVGLFFLMYFKFPKYSAQSLVECISDAPKRQMAVTPDAMANDSFTRFVQSQALYIKSFPVLKKALQDPEVRSTKWYKNIDQDRHLLELQDDLSASAIRDSNYIRVSISTAASSDPAIIVNTVVKTYLEEIKERASSVYRQELTDYKREQSGYKDQLVKKNQQISDFVLTLPAGEAFQQRDQLGQGPLRDKLSEAQRTVQYWELQVKEMKSLRDIYSDPAGMPITPEDRLIVENDPRVLQYDNQVFLLEQELGLKERQFGINHREYKTMKNRLVEVRQQLEKVRSNKLRETLDYKSEQAETAFLNATNMLLTAQEKLQQVEAEQSDLDRKFSEYVALLNERDLLIEIQNRIDEYIREIERIVRERAAIRVFQAVQASPPLERSFPSLLLLPGLVILGLAGAVGLAIGLELIDTSVRTPQDIVRHLNIAMLGSIPDVDDEEVEIENVETAVRDAPHSMVTEAFRTVRGNLQFSAPADRIRSILISSPRPEDGRTTVATNLATSLAVSGKRVLLVDTNFRRPRMHRIFKNVNARGMTNILIGEATLKDCVHHTDMANLDVIGSGPIPPNPAELLGSDLCREFVDEASRQYDHVIFDSPPVLLASDAIALASQVDGTILVFRAKENSRGVAQRACSMLWHANAHVFGAVLNGAQAQRGGYFREQLRTFYEYQYEEEEGSQRALPANEDKRDGEDD